jgi:GDP-mannose 6-dehydrogenase
MRAAVFGLGYVGCVSAACLADAGHTVTGVDVNALKVDLLRSGQAPVMEPGLRELIAKNREAGRLSVSDRADEAVMESEISLVCVGTPQHPNGSADLEALERTTESIGHCLAKSATRHTVVIRSTCEPGTCRNVVAPVLERSSGLRAGVDFGLAMNPEFLREGTSIEDFLHPSRTVIGEIDTESGDAVERLYEGIQGSVFRVPLEVAEMVKYADNAFHALKITFANEIGAVSRGFGVDSHEVIEILCADKKLNISTAYLRPGFAFGGSCLPKDLRALVRGARHADLELPLLESILPSNEAQLRRLVDLVVSFDRRRVGVVGLAFKPGTDDLRESPLVELSERLLGKGFNLKIFDPAVSMSRIVGSNREYIDQRIPHIASLLVDTIDELFDHSEVCVIGSNNEQRVEKLAADNGRIIVDLVRLPRASEMGRDSGYVGIAW